MRKTQRIPLYKTIWCKIRYWQSLQDVPDSQLAQQLQLTERTMRDYDKSARQLTLEKVDIFLQANHMELHDLMTM